MFKLEKTETASETPLSYAHANDSGVDLRSSVDTRVVGLFDVMLNVANLVLAKLDPTQIPLSMEEIYEPFWELVPSGYKISDMEPGSEIQVRPRSGLAKKYGISVLNSPGTCDEGYRGEIGAIVVNFGASYLIEKNDKIAQIVQTPVIREESFLPTDSKVRLENGYGSTGV